MLSEDVAVAVCLGTNVGGRRPRGLSVSKRGLIHGLCVASAPTATGTSFDTLVGRTPAGDDV